MLTCPNLEWSDLLPKKRRVLLCFSGNNDLLFWNMFVPSGHRCCLQLEGPPRKLLVCLRNDTKMETPPKKKTTDNSTKEQNKTSRHVLVFETTHKRIPCKNHTPQKKKHSCPVAFLLNQAQRVLHRRLLVPGTDITHGCSVSAMQTASATATAAARLVV